MQRKRCAVILAALCILSTLSFAGCSDPETAEVYLLNRKPESATAYEEIAKQYKEKTGVTVKVVTADAEIYEETLQTELAKADAPTVFQIDGPVGYEDLKDHCLDLKDSRLYSLLADRSLAVTGGDGGVYGIPYEVEAYGIVYNDEILRRYFALPDKKSSLGSAGEITDFDALKTVVEDMTDHKDALGIDGVFASTAHASEEDRRWQIQLLSLPLYYEFRENEDYDDPILAVMNAKEIAFRFSKHFRGLLDLYLDNSATPKAQHGGKSEEDAVTEFALGKAAMMQTDTHVWTKISKTQGNTVKAEDLKILPLYAGIDGEKGQGLCIGSAHYFAVNKSADEKQQKASLDFLEWLFSDEDGKKLVSEKLGLVTPFNTFTDADLRDDPLAKETLRYLKDDSVTNIPWVFAAFPGENYRKELGSTLLEYLRGDKGWDDIEAAVRDAWKRARG